MARGSRTLLTRINRLLANRHGVQTGYPCRVYRSTKRQTFFGYYDKTCFSSDGSVLLAHSVDCPNRADIRGIEADIGVFDEGDTRAFRKMGTTTAWSWQLGSRLMWYGPSDRHSVIHNVERGAGFGSVIRSVRTGKIEQEFEFPVFDVDANGRYAGFLCFSRLADMRPGYGYQHSGRHPGYLEPEGIWLADLARGERHLLIGIDELQAMEPAETMRNAQHYVNHLSFSPTGSRLLFYHFWSDGTRKHSRALIFDRSKNAFEILRTAGNMSHYVWKSDDELIIYCSQDGRGGYHLFRLATGRATIIESDSRIPDGHPSLLEGQLLCDTYPRGPYGAQTLFLLGLEKKSYRELARFFPAALVSGERRCDLHPRVNSAETQICVDFLERRGRSMVVLDVPHGGPKEVP